MTRGQLKANIRSNLADAGVTFYTDNDLNDSLQDAYDDIACLTQCIVKNVTLDWQNQLTYYNFQNFGVADYLGTIAIFNNVTNRWLRDDLNLRDLDRVRRDWEQWIGTPQFWTSSDPLHIAIAPKYLGAQTSGGAFYGKAFYSKGFFTNFLVPSLGTFKLLYTATAPQFIDDTTVPLIASDVQNLFEFYSTGDLLEQNEEFSKASEFFGKYYDSIEEYSDRVKRMNKSDLLLRI